MMLNSDALSPDYLRRVRMAGLRRGLRGFGHALLVLAATAGSVLGLLVLLGYLCGS